MKSFIFLLCVTAGLTQIAGAATFNFDEVSGYKPDLMLLNFAEACFVQAGKRYELSPQMDDCVGEGGTVADYLDGPTSLLAERCSRLNVLKNYQHVRDTDGSYFTFKKSYEFLDRETIVDARAACADLVRLFAAMPFNVYGKKTKECRKMIGVVEDCVRLHQTPTGVVVGFFFTLPANQLYSQCESLQAAQIQPPNLICTSPLPRVSPDLRFRTKANLSECPPLVPVANPAACQSKQAADSLIEQRVPEAPDASTKGSTWND